MPKKLDEIVTSIYATARLRIPFSIALFFIMVFPAALLMAFDDGTGQPDLDRIRAGIFLTLVSLAAGCVVVLLNSLEHQIQREKEIARERRELLSIASHQMLTPLTGMYWISDMLMRGEIGPLTPDQRRNLSEISDINMRLVTLVKDMLNTARLESGKFAFTPVETDLAALAETAAKEMTPLFEKRHQRFSLELPKGLAPLRLDGKLMKEALLNLLSNACKYTPEGGRVSLSVEALPACARVTVKDDGIGIPLEQQKDLFKKFYRAGNAVQSGIEGTGLGLYLVKEVVERSGGSLDFVSASDKGTAFTITLPRA